jgi:excisionase family DNA binding protein
MDKKLVEQKFTVTQAAEMLGLHPISVRRKIADESLGHFRFNEKILIGESHLKDFVKRSERKPR